MRGPKAFCVCIGSRSKIIPNTTRLVLFHLDFGDIRREIGIDDGDLMPAFRQRQVFQRWADTLRNPIDQNGTPRVDHQLDVASRRPPGFSVAVSLLAMFAMLAASSFFQRRSGAFWLDRDRRR